MSTISQSKPRSIRELVKYLDINPLLYAHFDSELRLVSNLTDGRLWMARVQDGKPCFAPVACQREDHETGVDFGEQGFTVYVRARALQYGYMPSRFPMGELAMTPGAIDALNRARVPATILLAAHIQGDYGVVSAADAKSNDEAIASGDRILSAYIVGDDKVWIITEGENDDGEREVTTILLPSEY